MTETAQGTFEVNLVALPLQHEELASNFMRRSIDKIFSGDLQATTQGEMFAAGTAVSGSAGYVAIEKVSGTLAGRKGTFILQHNGIMNRGEPSLSVVVIPDSGTDELAGISGKLAIDIRDGKHFYWFDYELPAL